MSTLSTFREELNDLFATWPFCSGSLGEGCYSSCCNVTHMFANCAFNMCLYIHTHTYIYIYIQ